LQIVDRSALKCRNGLPYFEAPGLSNGIRHAFLTRRGGISPAPFDSLNLSVGTGDCENNVLKNTQRIASIFDFEPDCLIVLHQVHQDRILIVKESLDESVLRLPSDLPYDAVITDLPGRVLGIKTADCLPILVADRTKKVIAAIHAGRQGTALQITRKVIRRMKTEFGCVPDDLWAALGPSISACCYEIDEKVMISSWEPFAAPKKGGKWMVDLGGINIDQMKREDILGDHISRIQLCTCCHHDLFFSFRKERRTGRQISFIAIA